MKFYLSSYKLGEKAETLKEWMAFGEKKVGYIPNAFDFTKMDPENRKKHMDFDIAGLKDLGFTVEVLDLRDFFGKKEELEGKLKSLDMLWVSGGNTFVLRQAMKLSGFDTLFAKLRERKDFVYGAYSAGCCVLSTTLLGLQIVDEPFEYPYPESQETIWEGLGVLDYMFLPHFDSDHPESADIDKEVEYCKMHGLPFKTVRDGEVIAFQD